MNYIKVEGFEEPLKAFDASLEIDEELEIGFIEGMNANGYNLIKELDLTPSIKRLIFSKN